MSLKVRPPGHFLIKTNPQAIHQSKIVQAGTHIPGQSAAIPPVQSKLPVSSTHCSPGPHCKPANVAQIRFGVQTPGQSCAPAHGLFGSCTHVSPVRHGGRPLESQSRSFGGSRGFATQMPLQSAPVVVGSQVSRGSSTQISSGLAHWMFPIPPQKTGSGATGSAQ